ncbi:unnamed protein product [Diatraea saccharalis]|uniref:Uncharacterized protein n=1 Tax=Diatraea saccharalis TaxID=40085 RepID=A0A9N9WGR8_9NEOP|nr:unnamed protein product [Diatraea saccharalis]
MTIAAVDERLTLHPEEHRTSKDHRRTRHSSHQHKREHRRQHSKRKSNAKPGLKLKSSRTTPPKLDADAGNKMETIAANTTTAAAVLSVPTTTATVTMATIPPAANAATTSSSVIDTNTTTAAYTGSAYDPTATSSVPPTIGQPSSSPCPAQTLQSLQPLLFPDFRAILAARGLGSTPNTITGGFPAFPAPAPAFTPASAATMQVLPNRTSGTRAVASISPRIRDVSSPEQRGHSGTRHTNAQFSDLPSLRDPHQQRQRTIYPSVTKRCRKFSNNEGILPYTTSKGKSKLNMRQCTLCGAILSHPVSRHYKKTHPNYVFDNKHQYFPKPYYYYTEKARERCPKELQPPKELEDSVIGYSSEFVGYH